MPLANDIFNMQRQITDLDIQQSDALLENHGVAQAALFSYCANDAV